MGDAEARLDLHDVDIADLTTTVAALGSVDVGDLFTYLTIDTATNSVIFSGANVYVQSGSGATDGAVNGLGNLIVGYDEDIAMTEFLYPPADRSGSHNLVVGEGHSYSSYGVILGGTLNTVSAPGGAVIGGVWNSASGWDSALVGGNSNTASGFYAATLGGSSNSASGDYASVAGGGLNTADADFSSILGGSTNSTTRDYATISGGVFNIAGGPVSSILGGNGQTTSADYETIPAAGGVGDLATYLTVDTATNSVIFSGANVYVQSGSGATDGALNGLGNLIIGYDETADDLGYGMYVESDHSGSHNLVVGMGNAYTSYGGLVAGMLNSLDGVGASVCGGTFNVASGLLSHVSGGGANRASGDYSSVVGGNSNGATAEQSAVLGGYFNNASALGATVSGGVFNSADGIYSSVLGGYFESTSEEDETYPN
jgi:hypothetical protein